ncbi:hypothetical protein EDB80DRAFT_577217 [Ilyonectria destructans]|nr:hypothetical protein EDB80DRAFT_577217 [Ilyonectria destructans]
MRKQAAHRGPEEALYQCSQCYRRYHRTEHLTRHVRSHTKQRPYSCGFCAKSFARLDVLKRHETTHGDAEPRLKPPNSQSAVDRVSQACKLCAASKCKCSEQKPCHRCVAKGLECTYPDDVEDSIQVQNQIQHQIQDGDQHRNQNGQLQVAPFPDGEAVEQLASPATAVSEISAQSEPDPQRVVDDALSPMHRFLGPMDLPDLLDLSAQAPGTAGGFSFAPAWDLATIDFSSLEAQFDAPGPDTFNLVPDVEIPSGSDASPAITEHHGTLSVTGSWEPQHSDNGEMERPHLAAGEEGFNVPELNKSPGVPPLGMTLSTAARDSILGMILGSTSHANAAQIVTAFPSTDTLNTLIRNYAQDRKAGYINDILHLPTLQLNQQRPELLGAMVAMGAINAGSSVARKFGYAMQEVVRTSSFRTWEGDNADFRDISLSQGFFLQQYMAFFSGARRKIALAEACSKCVQVLIKNGGHLQGALEHDDQGLVAVAGLGSQSLETAWRRWSIRESQRRLIYAAYIMDAHVSMSHGSQVMSSYVDMKIPLPAPRGLWTAETSTQWRDEMLLLQKLPRPSRPVCLKDVMSDPTLIAMHHDLIDMDFADLGFLAGIWVLIKECHQLSSLCRDSSTWSSLLLSSRRAELCSVLKLFGSETLRLKSSPETELLFEVVSIHALIFPDNLLLPELSSLPVHNRVIIPTSAYDPRSVSRAEYRAALWRTGRTVRAASRCPTGVLGGIYAVALFHAAILLWWHGIISARQMAQGLASDGARYNVCLLDSDDSHEHQMLSSHVRLALLSPDSEPIPLENPFDVMERLKSILEHNWRDNQMPAGVQEICRVLMNLGKAAHNYVFELD